MDAVRTWRDVVVDALTQLGGEAHYKKIADLAALDSKAVGNTRVQEKVRQVLRAYAVFEPIGTRTGKYRLAAPSLVPQIDALVTTKDITDEIQGKLLYVGRANNFDTFAPADDCAKRKFGGKPLSDLVTIRSLADLPVKKSKLDAMINIDVLWLREDKGGEIVPFCAFEVEHTTKVLEGLNRMNNIPYYFDTRLFIVGKDDSQHKLYDRHINSPTFKKDADRFRYQDFDSVRSLYKVAESYATAYQENNAVLEQFGVRK